MTDILISAQKLQVVLLYWFLPSTSAKLVSLCYDVRRKCADVGSYSSSSERDRYIFLKSDIIKVQCGCLTGLFLAYYFCQAVWTKMKKLCFKYFKWREFCCFFEDPCSERPVLTVVLHWNCFLFFFWSYLFVFFLCRNVMCDKVLSYSKTRRETRFFFLIWNGGKKTGN